MMEQNSALSSPPQQYCSRRCRVTEHAALLLDLLGDLLDLIGGNGLGLGAHMLAFIIFDTQQACCLLQTKAALLAALDKLSR